METMGTVLFAGAEQWRKQAEASRPVTSQHSIYASCVEGAPQEPVDSDATVTLTWPFLKVEVSISRCRFGVMASLRAPEPFPDGAQPPHQAWSEHERRTDGATQAEGAHESAFRRFQPRKGSMDINNDRFSDRKRSSESLLLRSTVALSTTFSRCGTRHNGSSGSTQEQKSQAITVPSSGITNGGLDNENCDLILRVDDVFQSSCGYNYKVMDLLGQGTFGQVARCLCQETGEMVAVKVIKNQAAYYNQACMEVRILQLLNHGYDPNDQRHIVRLLDNFVHCGHLCLVFELLYVNLYELLKHNQFRGLSMSLIRVLTAQILDTLIVLREAKVIHCDLKPENVLLKGADSGEIKMIDFGSACFENRTVYSYIQSRFYRSPEILLGHPYTVAIDMWSFGCLAAELFLGLPLFPGASEYDLLLRIIEMLGMPPKKMLAIAKNTRKYFVTSPGDSGEDGEEKQYRLMSQQEVQAHTKQAAPLGKRYFKHTQLADIIGSYPMAESDSPNDQPHNEREAFLDLLLGVLDLDPTSRWTPRQAMQHPFVTGSPFTGPFQPQQDPPPVPQRRQQPAAGCPIPGTSMPMGGSLPVSNWGAMASGSSGTAMGFPSSGSFTATHGFPQQQAAAILPQSAPHNLHYGYNNAIAAAAAAAAAAAVAAASWQQPAPVLSSSWQQLHHSMQHQLSAAGSAPQAHGFVPPHWVPHSPNLGSTMPVMSGGLSALHQQLSVQQQQHHLLSQSYGSPLVPPLADPFQLSTSWGHAQGPRTSQADTGWSHQQQHGLHASSLGAAGSSSCGSLVHLQQQFQDAAADSAGAGTQQQRTTTDIDEEELEHGDPGDYLPFFSDEQLIEDFSKLQPDT